ncbi:hypothetical protein EC991_010351 [Linnemannia zychae]|nr:hypothetical protein EC991_010351 [Linnemannia zychae]
MTQQEEKEGIQPIRLASQDKTVDVATYHDDTIGRHIVLWEDILVVFSDALYLQHNDKTLPFLKGPDLEALDPLRIAAVPGTILDVVVTEVPAKETPTGALVATRNPMFGLEEAAMDNYSHIDRPNASAPGPQLVPDATTDQPVFEVREEQPDMIDIRRAPHVNTEEFEQSISQTGLIAAATQASVEDKDEDGGEDILEKIERLKDDAEEGSIDAQMELATIYANGQGVPQDYREASVWYFEAVKAGHIGARVKMGWLYENGLGVIQDYQMALEFYQKAAEHNDPEGQTCIGDINYYGRGWPVDYYTAMYFYTRAAAEHYGPAQMKVADMYITGTGIPQNYEAASIWIYMAVKDGYPEGQVLYGRWHEEGIYVSKNESKALELYLKAAEQGNADGQCCVGSMYERGLGGAPQDYPKAIEWYFKAVKQDNPAAQTKLGLLYEKGLGVPQDYSTAMEWYINAANQGYAAAQSQIGSLFERGLGVPQDHAKASEWYQKAAKKENKVAEESVRPILKSDHIDLPPKQPRQQTQTQQRKEKKKWLLGNAIKKLFRSNGRA